MKRYADRVQEKASSSGTADFTLAGAVVGYRPFTDIAGIQAGDTLVYLAIDHPDWEVGLGTYAAGTLGRTTIFSSSSGAKVAFANPPFVLNTLSASEMASLGTVAVQSVNGQTGVVVLNAGHVGADPVGSASAAEAAAKAASDPVGAAASAQAAAIAASQPRDGDLTALSALSGTGTIRRTGPDAYVLDPPVTFPVTSVNTKTGAVTLNAAEVGADPAGSAAAAQAAAIAASQPRETRVGVIRFELDGGGSAIATGLKKAIVRAPYNGTITGWTLLADVSGTLTLDVWKDTYTAYPPVVGDSITGTAKPALSGNKGTSTTLTGWNVTITAGDIFLVNVDTAATVTHALLEINYNRT